MCEEFKINKLQKIKSLYDKGLSGHEIAKLTSYNRSYVYRVVSKLIKSRDINAKETSKSEKGQGRRLGVSFKNNVHAQRVRFFVSFMSDKYKSHPNSNFKEFIPGVNIQCKGRVIYGYASKKFDGVDEVAALNNSLDFWNHVVRRLEDRLNIVIGGRGKPAFEFLYEETETRDSELGADAVDRGKRWIVTHDDDGKLRLCTDWSDDGINHETYHSRDSHVDSLTFNRHMNSILNNPNAPNHAEIVKLLYAQADINKETAEFTKESAAAMLSLVKFLDSGVKKDDSVFVDDSFADYFG